MVGALLATMTQSWTADQPEYVGVDDSGQLTPTLPTLPTAVTPPGAGGPGAGGPGAEVEKHKGLFGRVFDTVLGSADTWAAQAAAATDQMLQPIDDRDGAVGTPRWGR